MDLTPFLTEPCPFPAGSQSKMAVLAARIAQGLPSHVPGDNLRRITPPGSARGGGTRTPKPVAGCRAANEATRRLGVHVPPLFRWVKLGQLPRPLRVCGCWRWHEADIDAGPRDRQAPRPA